MAFMGENEKYTAKSLLCQVSLNTTRNKNDS